MRLSAIVFITIVAIAGGSYKGWRVAPVRNFYSMPIKLSCDEKYLGWCADVQLWYTGAPPYVILGKRCSSRTLVEDTIIFKLFNWPRGPTENGYEAFIKHTCSSTGEYVCKTANVSIVVPTFETENYDPENEPRANTTVFSLSSQDEKGDCKPSMDE